MSACYCDYDAPEFYISSQRTARKRHRCEECCCFILPGERYEHVSAKWEGSLSTVKTCAHCLALRDWVTGNVPCACWSHGDMIDGLWSSIEDAVDRAPDETRGLMFGFLRRRYVWLKATRERRVAAEPFYAFEGRAA